MFIFLSPSYRHFRSFRLWEDHPCATTVKEELGDKVTVITRDNYYHDMSDLTFEEKKLANFDCPDSSDFALLTEHLMDLKNNLTIHQPNYDFCTHSRTNLVNVIKPTDILVIEEALLFVIPEIRDLCDIKLRQFKSEVQHS